MQIRLNSSLLSCRTSGKCTVLTTLRSVMRRDLSVTLFLSDPSTYDGGELEVESPGGLKRIKPEAGAAFAYATHAIHQVRPVTRGVRYPAIFWLQSLIQDDQMRQSLFDLQAVTTSLAERCRRAGNAPAEQAAPEPNAEIFRSLMAADKAKPCSPGWCKSAWVEVALRKAQRVGPD